VTERSENDSEVSETAKIRRHPHTGCIVFRQKVITQEMHNIVKLMEVVLGHSMTRAKGTALRPGTPVAVGCGQTHVILAH
jgi:hypothetical protein